MGNLLLFRLCPEYGLRFNATAPGSLLTVMSPDEIKADAASTAQHVLATIEAAEIPAEVKAQIGEAMASVLTLAFSMPPIQGPNSCLAMDTFFRALQVICTRFRALRGKQSADLKREQHP